MGCVTVKGCSVLLYHCPRPQMSEFHWVTYDPADGTSSESQRSTCTAPGASRRPASTSAPPKVSPAFLPRYCRLPPRCTWDPGSSCFHGDIYGCSTGVLVVLGARDQVCLNLWLKRSLGVCLRDVEDNTTGFSPLWGCGFPLSAPVELLPPQSLHQAQFSSFLERKVSSGLDCAGFLETTVKLRVN